MSTVTLSIPLAAVLKQVSTALHYAAAQLDSSLSQAGASGRQQAAPRIAEDVELPGVDADPDQLLERQDLWRGAAVVLNQRLYPYGSCAVTEPGVDCALQIELALPSNTAATQDAVLAVCMAYAVSAIAAGWLSAAAPQLGQSFINDAAGQLSVLDSTLAARRRPVYPN